MAQAWQQVRMLRHIDQFVQVMELEADETYRLTAESAARLIDAGAAVAVAESDSKAKRLEAAALATPTRRG